jgi:hypothetical protein
MSSIKYKDKGYAVKWHEDGIKQGVILEACSKEILIEIKKLFHAFLPVW